jgi:hypothetical protein
VKTPARINNAASSAATTAQLSMDSSQPFFVFSDTALVLIVLSLIAFNSPRYMAPGDHLRHRAKMLC